MQGQRAGGSRETGVDPRREAVQQQRERRKLRLATLLIVALLLAVGGILVAGYVVKFVLPPREVLVRVNDVSYTRGDLVKMLRVQQRGAEFLGVDFRAGTEVFNVLQQLVQNEIMVQAAPNYGITVSEEEVDADLRSTLLTAEMRATLQGASLESAFQERYHQYLTAIGLSEREHRSTVRKSLMRQRFTEFVSDTVPTVAEQVRLHRIVMNQNSEYQVMGQKYAAATDRRMTPDELRAAIKDIVREFSLDSQDIVRKGGDLGWVPRGVMPDFEDAFFDLEVGVMSPPVQDFDREGVFYYFVVSERQPAQELSKENHQLLAERALTDWLNKERDRFEVYSVLNSQIYDWVLVQLGLSAPQTRQRAPAPAAVLGMG